MGHFEIAPPPLFAQVLFLISSAEGPEDEDRDLRGIIPCMMHV